MQPYGKYIIPSSGAALFQSLSLHVPCLFLGVLQPSTALVMIRRVRTYRLYPANGPLDQSKWNYVGGAVSHQISTLDIVMGSLYMGILVIEAFGVYSAWKASLSRAYVALAFQLIYSLL